MKATELREMTDVELNKQLKDLKAELFNLRFQRATGKLTNTARFGEVKKEIARINFDLLRFWDEPMMAEAIEFPACRYS